MSDIKVNASEWNALRPEQQSHISKIMKEHGFLPGTAKIVGDAAAPRSEETVKAASAHLHATALAHEGVASASALAAGFSWCKIGCDVAEAAAVAACALVPTPGNTICFASAHTGGEFCRGKCM